MQRPRQTNDEFQFRDYLHIRILFVLKVNFYNILQKLKLVEYLFILQNIVTSYAQYISETKIHEIPNKFSRKKHILKRIKHSLFAEFELLSVIASSECYHRKINIQLCIDSNRATTTTIYDLIIMKTERLSTFKPRKKNQPSVICIHNKRVRSRRHFARAFCNNFAAFYSSAC